MAHSESQKDAYVAFTCVPCLIIAHIIQLVWSIHEYMCFTLRISYHMLLLRDMAAQRWRWIGSCKNNKKNIRIERQGFRNVCKKTYEIEFKCVPSIPIPAFVSRSQTRFGYVFILKDADFFAHPVLATETRPSINKLLILKGIVFQKTSNFPLNNHCSPAIMLLRRSKIPPIPNLIVAPWYMNMSKTHPFLGMKPQKWTNFRQSQSPTKEAHPRTDAIAFLL